MSVSTSSDFAKLFHLVRYHFSVSFRKIRPYPPLVVWLLFLFTLYQQVPVNMVDNYSVSASVMFYVMIWFGYLFLSDFDMVVEHLLILQINSKFLNATSKVLFLLTVCLFVGFIGGVFPIIIQTATLLMGGTWFDMVGVAELFGGFFLHFIIGSLGVSVAFLFQLNPDKRNKNLVMVFALTLFAVLALVKHQVFGFDGVMRHALLLFTPAYEILRLFSYSEAFKTGDMLLAAVMGSIYFMAAVIIGHWLYNKRVYGPLIANEDKELNKGCPRK